MNLAPTASTTASLALGDALAMALSSRKGFREEQFANLHPGGRLGKKLMRVGALMHADDAIPRVRPNTPMTQVVAEMSIKGLGMTCVVDEAGRLEGILTDGDLRRHLIADRTCWTGRRRRNDLPAGNDRPELSGGRSASSDGRTKNHVSGRRRIRTHASSRASCTFTTCGGRR